MSVSAAKRRLSSIGAVVASRVTEERTRWGLRCYSAVSVIVIGLVDMRQQ